MKKKLTELQVKSFLTMTAKDARAIAGGYDRLTDDTGSDDTSDPQPLSYQTCGRE